MIIQIIRFYFFPQIIQNCQIIQIIIQIFWLLTDQPSANDKQTKLWKVEKVKNSFESSIGRIGKLFSKEFDEAGKVDQDCSLFKRTSQVIFQKYLYCLISRRIVLILIRKLRIKRQRLVCSSVFLKLQSKGWFVYFRKCAVWGPGAWRREWGFCWYLYSAPFSHHSACCLKPFLYPTSIAYLWKYLSSHCHSFSQINWWNLKKRQWRKTTSLKLYKLVVFFPQKAI